MNKQLHYKPRTDVNWIDIKKESLKYCTGYFEDDRLVTETDVLEELKPLCNALSSVNYNINDFFRKKLYLNINNKELLSEYLLTVCLTQIKPMSDYVADLMNDYLDLFSIDKNIAERAEWHPANEIEILEYMWYCRQEEDIWFMLSQGVGNIKELFDLYMGAIHIPENSNAHFPPCYYKRNEKKALRMILYLEYNFATNKAIATTTRSLYNNADARKSIWQMLLPELTEETWIFLAKEYDLSAAQISNVVIKYLSIIDDLPSGWGMDLFSRISFINEFCESEISQSIKNE